jgi:hypothetical protein
LHEVRVFLSLTSLPAVAVALALPRIEFALAEHSVPVLAVAVTIGTAVPRGGHRAAWACVGFGRSSRRVLVLGVVVLTASSS